ncbi:LysR substrate-binding domain-containing protein [Paracoccus sp. DMF]|uniref:LysR substrate-binding domain-containing protein n=1 Tax=Paracoccus sp. DMF TaxID=400837 RepID=UPI001102F1AD|nr:LysR substrate-binding domain-containing protein [Paracoccus sp. DMF]MCV2448837.1 LysR substrate-binding domain-containing protein [Paracoccus sp. DMF]
MPRPYDTSSMTALICFEAAARNAGFKAAAAELNVTPAAISHQVKALERDLGCALFRRLHRGVELTEKGAFLLLALQRGFEAISDAVTELKRRPEQVDVTIRATTAVSALWLTPQITRFWKVHPTITVSQIVSDVPGGSGRYDIAVGYGPAERGPAEVHELYRDRIIALGTRKFAQDENIVRLEDLLRAPLIHMNHDQVSWTGWRDWLRELGLPESHGRNFHVNNHMIALQAAEDHIGAVLGWERLVRRHLDEGRLVPLVGDFIESPQPFQLEIQSRASQKARVFAAWLMAHRDDEPPAG